MVKFLCERNQFANGCVEWVETWDETVSLKTIVSADVCRRRRQRINRAKECRLFSGTKNIVMNLIVFIIVHIIQQLQQQAELTIMRSMVDECDFTSLVFTPKTRTESQEL